MSAIDGGTKSQLRGHAKMMSQRAKRTAAGKANFTYLADEINRLKRKHGEIAPETKVVYSTYTGTLASAARSALNINQVALGTGDNQRVGSAIRIKNIQVRGRMVDNTTQAPLIPCSFWLVRPTDSAAPVATDFTGTFYEHDKGWEMCHRLMYGSNSESFYQIDLDYKFDRPMRVEYETGLAQPIKNAIFMCLWNNTSSTAFYEFDIAVWYTD